MIRRTVILICSVAAMAMFGLWAASVDRKVLWDPIDNESHWVFLAVCNGHFFGFVIEPLPGSVLRGNKRDMRAHLVNTMGDRQPWEARSPAWQLHNWSDPKLALRGHSLVFPLWAPLLCALVYPVIALLRGPVRRQLRWQKGLCVECGYDLTGNVTGRCPECGNRDVQPKLVVRGDQP